MDSVRPRLARRSHGYDRGAVPIRTKLLASCTVAAAAAAASLPATSAAAPAVGVDTAGTTLLRFDTASPGTMTPVPITGLGAGETIEGIDRRPATGALYGLGVIDGGASDTLRVYRIDLATGVATPIGAPITAPTGGTDYGVDFNPFSDRLRVVNDANENMRLNPNNGAIAGDDTNITDLGADPDSRPIEGVAHSSSVAAPFGFASGTPTTQIGGLDTFYDAVRTRRNLYVELDHLDRETGVCGRPEYELYDLKRDPFQLRNTAAYIPERPAPPRQARLAARLDSLRICSGIAGRDPVTARPFCD